MKTRYLLILVPLFLIACTGQQTNKYYTGTNGVEASFPSGSPPDTIFIRGDETANFTIDVRIRNKGASVTKGGVYLSGYDPTLVDVKEIDEDRGVFKACRMDIRGLKYGQFDGMLTCNKLNLGPLGSPSIGVNWEDGVSITVQDLNLGNVLDNLFNTRIFTAVGFDKTHLQFDSQQNGKFSISFDNPQFNADRASRGPYFLSLWAPWSFELNQGQSYTLPGDTPENPGVNEEFITYHAQADLPSGQRKTTVPFQATNCYLYTTHASTSVCIDPNPRSNDEKVCTPGSYTRSTGQGAPLAITSVTQEQGNDAIVFTITVKNQGDGMVYNPLMIQQCSPYHPDPVTEEQLNTAVLGMVYVGDQMLECTPTKHTVKLYNGRGKIKCVLDLEDQFVSSSGYTSPMMVELWYGYSETIRETVTIQRI